jgi:hypothetical protein
MAVKFSDDERAAILAESFGILERRDEALANAKHASLLPPSETTNERHRRQIDERNARWARERNRREADAVRTAATMDREQQAAWDNWVLAHISSARAKHDEVIAEALARYVGEELDKQRANFELKLDALRAELAKLRGIDDGIVGLLPPRPKRNAAA